MGKFLNALVGASLLLFSQAAVAAVCDYKPSKLIGTGGTVAIAAGSGAVAGAAGALKAAGVYTLVHSASGVTMLGSTLVGSSGAGTAGIVAGSATAGAFVASVVLSPLVWVPAITAAVGASVYEGGCYLADK